MSLRRLITARFDKARLARAYRAVRATPDGQAVIDDLLARTLFPARDSSPPLLLDQWGAESGRRSIGRHITELLNFDAAALEREARRLDQERRDAEWGDDE